MSERKNMLHKIATMNSHFVHNDKKSFHRKVKSSNRIVQNFAIKKNASAESHQVSKAISSSACAPRDRANECMFGANFAHNVQQNRELRVDLTTRWP